MFNINKIRKQFPLIDENQKLKAKFPYKNRKGGIGSGFINTANIVRAEPVFVPPIASFVVQYGEDQNLIGQSSFTSPGSIYSQQQSTSFTILNTTDDTTYATYKWKIETSDSGTFEFVSQQRIFLGSGPYIQIPEEPDFSILKVFFITLTVYNGPISSNAYMIFNWEPTTPIIASINFKIGNSQEILTYNENDPATLVFRNTTTGPPGITGILTSNNPLLQPLSTTLAGSFIIGITQTPFVVTLTISKNNVVLVTITQTITFNILPNAIAIISTPLTTINAIEDSFVDVLFTNTSTGTYDRIEWSSPSTKVIVNNNGNFIGRFKVSPNEPPITTTLIMYRDNVEVGRDTKTISFVVALIDLDFTFSLLPTGDGVQIVFNSLGGTFTYTGPPPGSVFSLYENVPGGYTYLNSSTNSLTLDLVNNQGFYFFKHYVASGREVTKQTTLGPLLKFITSAFPFLSSPVPQTANVTVSGLEGQVDTNTSSMPTTFRLRTGNTIPVSLRSHHFYSNNPSTPSTIPTITTNTIYQSVVGATNPALSFVFNNLTTNNNYPITFQIRVPLSYTEIYNKPQNFYLSNSLNLPTTSIFADGRYFSNGGRYNLQQNNLASLTFQFPTNTLYLVGVSQGGYTIGTTNLYTAPFGSWCSLINLTTFMSNNKQLTIKKVAGGQGIIYGFCCITI
jgi:hypothetical protein